MKKFKSLVPIITVLSLLAFYTKGMYFLFTDDKHYDTKFLVLGLVFPPYSIYVGAKESVITREAKTKTKKPLELRKFDNDIKRKFAN